ncbi:MAG: ECF transporter S component [Nitrososphaerota archaeon]|nr:ECF transporter S component [Candidatus Bathyarchaeota archaeon]MDW8048587.1 ECF transporter S component [Nitrososphaerota archaeon]
MVSNKTTKIAFISVLSVLCLSLQLSPRPPNVEFTSLLTFFSGFIFGSLVGGLFGGFVMFINGFLSPWGFAGLNMPFQMVGMGLVGLVGGLYRRFVSNHFSAGFCVEVAVLGALLTLIYDLITNLGYAVYQTLSDIPFNLALMIALAYGTPFSIIHVASNAALFGVALYPLIKVTNTILEVNRSG